MKFAHLGDCHLGGWRQPELKDLNFASFQTALQRCIKEKVDFVVISGDLFDSSYPPIDTLKDTFREFRRLAEINIPVFLIAGSHDYSASGKTFLDVLEKSGFCKNLACFEEHNGKIILEPTIYKNVALYGYPGKKSGLEVDDIARIRLNDAPGLFKILALHTAIRDAVGTLPIKAVDESLLPKVDYLALGHLHINYCRNGRAYSGPIFPNNLAELEELQGGSFYIITDGVIKKETVQLKKIVSLTIEITDSFTATDEIINELERKNLHDSIVILKVYGFLEKGKTSDIDFVKIENYVRKREAYVFLKSTSKLQTTEQEILLEAADSANLEQHIIKRFEDAHPSQFNPLILPLMKSLQIEKSEDERSAVFEDRLVEESLKLFSL